MVARWRVLVLLLAVGSSAADETASGCNPCVDGPEMQRPADLGTLPVAVHPISPADLRWAEAACLETTSQAGMTLCASNRVTHSGARLATELAAYRKRLSGRQLELFNASQAAWEAFRDAACAFEASGVEGGSAYSMVVSGCLATLTEARYRAVAELAGCEEGDLSCPVHE